MKSKLPILLLLLGLILPTLGILGFMLNALDSERLATQKQLENSFRIASKQSLTKWFSQQKENLENSSSTQELLQLHKQDLLQEHIAQGLILASAETTLFPTFAIRRNNIRHPEYKAAQKDEFIHKEYLAAHNQYYDIRKNVTSAIEYDFLTLSALRCLKNGDFEKKHSLNLASEFKEILERDSTASQSSIEIAFIVLTQAQPGNQTSSHAARDYIYNNLKAPSENISTSYRISAISKLIKITDLTQENFPWFNFEKTSLTYHSSNNEEKKAYAKSHGLSVWHLDSERTFALISNDNLQHFLTRKLREELSTNSLLVLVNPEIYPSNELFSMELDKFHPDMSIHVAWGNTGYLHDLSNAKYFSYILSAISIIAIIAACSAYLYLEYRKQQKYNELKNDILATVSHELITPLTSSRILLDNLAGDVIHQPDKVKEYLEILRNENSRLSQLVNNFLTYSRMERNKVRFYLEPTRTSEYIEGIIRNYTQRLSGKELDIDLTIESESIVNIDREMMEIALLNIVDNGRKYSNKGTTVNINVTTKDNFCVISIKDNGIGMSTETQTKIFDKFYRLDKKLNRATEGVGLGLSIVQNIVKNHRGNLLVSSKLNIGSTFSIELPEFKES